MSSFKPRACLGSSASTSSSADRISSLAFPEDDTSIAGHGNLTSVPCVNGFLPFFLDQTLTDVELLTASNTSIAAHKVVLAAHSAYFKAIFAGASSNFCVENSRSVVHVENIDDDVLRLLLRLMYSGDRLDAFPLESQSIVGRLMDAAAYLSAQSVVEACSTYLLESLHVGNAIDVYLLSGERVEYAHVHMKAMEFIVSNFGTVVRSLEGAEGLCQLSKEDVVHILCGRRADCVHKGIDVAMTLLLWTRHGEPSLRYSSVDSHDNSYNPGDQLNMHSMHDVEEIISRLRREMYRDEFCMAVDTIRDIEKESGTTLMLSSDVVERVGAALFGPDTPRFFGGGATNVDSEVSAGSPFPRDVRHRQEQYMDICPNANGNTIFAVGGIHSGWKAMRSTELYNIERDTWTPGQDMPFDCSFSHACTSSTGDTFIPIAKSTTMLLYTSNRLDDTSLHPANQWHAIDVHDARITPRASSAAVAFGNDVHVLGGRPSVGRDCHPVALHECFRSGRWQTLAPMNTPRASMDACTTLDRIWCVGGQSLRQTHDTMEWYEPAHDCWFTSSSKMSTPRKYTTVNAFRDQHPCSSQIIIMGGMNDVRTRLATVEAYDPREGCLRDLPPLPTPVSSAASCVSGYRVFIMGGRVGRHGAETDAVWSYDVRGGTWTACQSMRQARSSLTAFLRV